MTNSETMRAELMQRIAESLPDLDTDRLAAIQRCYDMTASRYDITAKCTALAPYDPFPAEAKQYLVSRKIEGLSDETLRNRAFMLKVFFEHVRKPVHQIEANDIRLYLYQYQQARHISDRSLESIRIGLGAFFVWLVDNDFITRNPMRNIKPIKYTYHQRTALTRLELEQLRDACINPRETAIIEFFFSTGCRCAELCKVRMNDINWDRATVRLQCKGKKENTAYLSAKCIVSLRKYLSTVDYESEYLFSSIRAPHGKLGIASVEKIVRQIEARANINKHITPHVIRHTTATLALKNGMPMEQLQILLGHKSMDTTRIYAEVDSSAVQDSHDKFIQ